MTDEVESSIMTIEIMRNNRVSMPSRMRCGGKAVVYLAKVHSGPGVSACTTQRENNPPELLALPLVSTCGVSGNHARQDTS